MEALLQTCAPKSQLNLSQPANAKAVAQGRSRRCPWESSWTAGPESGMAAIEPPIELEI